MSRGKKNVKNDEDLTQAEFDERYHISPEVRKELNKKEGWVTGGGKPMVKRKKKVKSKSLSHVDSGTQVQPVFNEYSNMGLG